MFPNMGIPLLEALAAAHVQDADREKDDRANHKNCVSHGWLLNLRISLAELALRNRKAKNAAQRVALVPRKSLWETRKPHPPWQTGPPSARCKSPPFRTPVPNGPFCIRVSY